MHRRLLLALLLAMFPTRLLAAAAPAYLVADLNTDPVEDSGSYPSGFVTINGVAYFVADDGLLGRELWRSDGTPAGTRLVKDINPGQVGSSPQELTIVGEDVWFRAWSDGRGCGLWRSDGTEAGTRLVAVVHTGLISCLYEDGNPTGLTPIGGAVFFAARDEVHGDELWRSDGTAAGTAMVADIAAGFAGSSPRGLIELSGTLYFIADDGEHGTELWRSDGSGAGTWMVRDIRPGEGSGALRGSLRDPRAPQMAVAGDALLFAADDGEHGAELWRSDGSTDGTALLLDSVAGSSAIGGLRIFNRATPFGRIASDALFFSLDGTRIPADLTLWRSDGTVEGTRQLGAVRPTGPSNFPRGLTAIGDAIYFTYGWGATATNLWRIAGGGATEVHRFVSPVGAPVVVDGALLLVAADDAGESCALFRSDGTPHGTVIVRDRLRGNARCPEDVESSAAGAYVAAIGERAFLLADEPGLGAELSVSDGTSAGTRLLRDINDASDRNAGSVIDIDRSMSLGDLLMFDAAPREGAPSALWRSDGTPTGTYPVAAVRFSVGTVVNGSVVFSVRDDDGGDALWSSDGTAAGTERLLPLPGFVSWAARTPSGQLFLTRVHTHDDTNVTLWHTDGTATGTQPVSFLTPSAIAKSIPFDGVLALVLSRASGDELWLSDGTEDGTRMVTAFPAPSRFVRDMVEAGAALYLHIEGAGGLSELWRSDGTAAGTRQVADLGPSGLSLSMGWLAAGPAGVFFAAADMATGYELWRADGTEAGTRLVRDLRPGPPGALQDSDGVYERTARVGGALLVIADDGVHGPELWRTDGTEPGTVLLRDIDPRDPAVIENNHLPLTEVGSQVLFVPVDGEAGREPWITDGTTAGTRRIADIAPGARSGLRQGAPFAATRTHVFFAADDGRSGEELWAIPRAALDGGPGCGGDCNGDFRVAIDELVRGVGIALGTTPVSACVSFDVDADGTVSIDELVGAVNAALDGC